MSGRDVALTGIPRAGTTLACRLLGLAEDTVALFEPMDVAALPAGQGPALDAVDAYFAATRARLLRDGVATSKLRDGEVPDNPFAGAAGDGERPRQVARGTLRVAPPPPGFTLVVKHNAAFTALLPGIAARRDTYAIVRNPLAVLGSWASVRLPVSDGRLPAGERLDPMLAVALGAEPDPLARRLRILEWCFSRFATALPRARVLRYEDIVASHGGSLFEAVGVRGRPDPALRPRNASTAYRDLDVAACLRGLLDAPGHWRDWYGEGELAALADAMPATGARP